MWATGTTNMIARLAGSTLFANHNLTSVVAHDHRAFAKKRQYTSSSDDSNPLARLREIRALTPYAIFVRDNYKEMSEQNPTLKMVEVSKRISSAWKNLPDNQRQIYFKLSQDQKVLYDQEKDRLSPKDLQMVDFESRNKLLQRQLRKTYNQMPTKRPRPAFFHFISTLDRGNAHIPDFMKAAAKRWGMLAEQDKQKYRDMYREEKNKYMHDVALWAASKKEEATPRTRSPSNDETSKKPVFNNRTVRTLSKDGSKLSSKKTVKEKSDKERSPSSSPERDSSPKVKTSSKPTDEKTS